MKSCGLCLFLIVTLTILALPSCWIQTSAHNNQIESKYNAKISYDATSFAEELTSMSLSNNVHLVVAAGTVGLYSVSGVTSEGLFLYFAEVSPVWETYRDRAESVAQWSLPEGSEAIDNLLFNPSFASCDGQKLQDQIYRVQENNVVTVRHSLHSSVGYVCASMDGKMYFPTNITYKVLGVRIQGFIFPLSSKHFSLSKEGQFTDWTFPKLATLADVEKDDGTIERDVGFEVGGRGIVQLVSELTHPRENELVGDWRFLLRSPRISHIRFSLTENCSATPATLFSPEVVVHSTSGANYFFYDFTNLFVSQNSFYNYLAHLGFSDLLLSLDRSMTPGTFYVCIAVRKKDPEKTLNTSSISQGRLASSTSVSRKNEENILFTLVPGLSGFLKIPNVAPRGMWVISPQSTENKVLIQQLDTEGRLKKTLVRIRNGTVGDAIGKSQTEIRVAQFSSPIIALDYAGVFPNNVVVELVGSKGQCGSNGHNRTVALSQARVRTISSGHYSYDNLPFFQLSVNHTELDENSSEIRWFVCFSFSEYLPSFHVADWSIVVYRNPLLVEKTTISIPETFRGPLDLPFLNTTFWSIQTIANSRLGLVESSQECASLTTTQLNLNLLPFPNGSTSVLIPFSHKPLLPGHSYRFCIALFGRHLHSSETTITVEPLNIVRLGSASRKTNYVLDVVVPSVNPQTIPISGGGITVSTTAFLSLSPCTSTDFSLSIWNISVVIVEPLPDEGNTFIVWPRITPQKADRLLSSQKKLYFCLFDRLLNRVVNTPFKVNAESWKVTKIENTVEDFEFFNSISDLRTSIHYKQPFVVQGSSVVLEVSGYNLNRAEIAPSWNCSDSSLFLWNETVILSRINSTSAEPVEQQCTNPLSCVETLFARINPQLTLRQRSPTTQQAGAPRWCSKQESGTEWLDTGIRYNLVVPSVIGFYSSSRSTLVEHKLQLFKTQSWHFLRLAGSLISLVRKDAIPLNVILAPQDKRCEEGFLSGVSTVSENGQLAVDISQISSFLPLKLCYSFGFGPGQSTNYVEVPSSSIELSIRNYSLPLITTINLTSQINLTKGVSTVFSVQGVGLTEATEIYFVKTGRSCYELPSAQSRKVANIVKRCPFLVDVLTGMCRGTEEFEVLFSHSFLSQFDENATYKLCFQTTADSPWLPSPVTARIQTEPSRGRPYVVWSSADISSLKIFAETKRTITQDAQNMIQYIITSSSIFSFWCGMKGNQMISCKNRLRVVLIPLRCYNYPSVTCELDDAQQDRWGPFEVTDGLLEIPWEAGNRPSEWWGFYVETGPRSWERVLESHTVFTPDQALHVGFSSSPSLPAPLNETIITNELILTQNRASVSYLTRFGTNENVKLRFGAFCEMDVTPHDLQNAGLDASNVSVEVQYRQRLNNYLLFTEPVPITNSLGAFVIPSTHVTAVQERTAMCLSVDGGISYKRTPLALTIRKESPYHDFSSSLLEEAEVHYSRTIFVFQNTAGNISLRDKNEKILWALGSGATVFVSSASCSNTAAAKISVQWWLHPSPSISLSPRVTAKPSRGSVLRLCAALPGHELEPLIDLDTTLYVVDTRLILTHAFDTTLMITSQVTAVPFELKRERRTPCEGSPILCSMDSNPLLAGGVAFLFSNSSCDAVDIEILKELHSVQYPTFTSAGDVGVRGILAFMPSEIPSAELGSRDAGILCISLDGGRRYMETGTNYYTAAASSTLLLSIEDHNNYSDTINISLAQNYLRGQFIDSRCMNSKFPVKACHLMSERIWIGFLDSMGWIENGMWHLHINYEHSDSHVLNFRRNACDADLVNTGSFLNMIPSELKCIDEKILTTLYIQQYDSGRLSYIPSECFEGISPFSKVYAITADPSGLPFSGNPCDDLQHVDRLQLEVATPGFWGTTKQDHDIAFQWPPALRCTPSGLYHLCVDNSLVRVQVKVGSAKPITAINGVSTGRVLLYQGSNAKLLFQGKAVDFGSSILVGFSPHSPRVVELLDGTMWKWENGCHDLPFVFSDTGVSILSRRQPFPADLLLTAPLTRIINGWLEIPASLQKYVSGTAGHIFCYSLDNGISFNVVEQIEVAILPPTITGASPSTEFLKFVLPPYTTMNGLSVIHMMPPSDIETTFYSWSLLQHSKEKIMSHPPLYYISSFDHFSGLGFGTSTERSWPTEDGKKDVPTFVGSVAIVRSSVAGSVCNRMSVNEESLAVPIFLIDLNTGSLWSDFNLKNGEISEKLASANPVLYNLTWIEHTEAVRRQGGIHTDDFKSSNGVESLLVCLSLDGEHYYSPNFVEDKSIWLSAVSEVAAPLVLIPERSSAGTALTKGLTLMVSVLARNLNCGDPFPAISTSLFQQQLAQRINVDPSIIVAQVQAGGCLNGLEQNTQTEATKSHLSIALIALSITVSADSAPLRDSLIIQPSEKILLDVVNAIYQPSMLEYLNHESGEFIEFGTIGVTFFYSNGDQLSDEAINKTEYFSNVFLSVGSGLSVIEINRSEVESSANPFHWYAMLPVILFPLFLILGSLALYHKYLVVDTNFW